MINKKYKYYNKFIVENSSRKISCKYTALSHSQTEQLRSIALLICSKTKLIYSQTALGLPQQKKHNSPVPKLT